MSYNQETDDGYPSWWDDKGTRVHKGEWTEGAEAYIELNDISVEDMEFDESQLKKMIPHIALKDKRWKQFPLKKFDKEKHNLHKALFDAVKLKVQQLKAQDEMMRRAAEVERVSLERIQEENKSAKSNSESSGHSQIKGRRAKKSAQRSPRQTGKYAAKKQEKIMDFPNLI